MLLPLLLPTGAAAVAAVAAAAAPAAAATASFGEPAYPPPVQKRGGDVAGGTDGHVAAASNLTILFTELDARLPTGYYRGPSLVTTPNGTLLAFVPPLRSHSSRLYTIRTQFRDLYHPAIYLRFHYCAHD